MIEVHDLTKRYGDRMAIDRLNFSIKKGEVVGFLGPNGAGKSTTMKIVTGYMAPTSGFVKIAGHDVFEDPIEVKKRIGYLPEIPPVYGDMYVRDYLAYVAKLKMVARDQIKSHVDSAIEKTDLGEVQGRLISHLSKGFRQRVGLAQALVSNPEILILDEPTVGLDPKQVAEMRKLIRQLRGHHTIVLSTHILPEVQANCERIIIINRGRIVAEESLEDLSRRMTGGRRVTLRVRRSRESIADSLKNVKGVQDVHSMNGFIEVDIDEQEDTIEAIASHIVNQGAGLLEMRSDHVSLEDIFIQLTSEQKEGGARL